MMLRNCHAIIGYPFDYSQGPVREDTKGVATRNKEEKSKDVSAIFFPPLDRRKWNIICCFPPLGLVMGIFRILEGCQKKPFYIDSRDHNTFRAIQILTGIAELTIVGGVIVHGGATLYFFYTRPQPEKNRGCPEVIHKQTEEFSGVPVPVPACVPDPNLKFAPF